MAGRREGRAARRRGAGLVEVVLAAGLVGVAALGLAAPVTRAVAAMAEASAARERLGQLAVQAAVLAAAARSDGCGAWPAPPPPLAQGLVFSSGTWVATLVLPAPRRAPDSLRVGGDCPLAGP